MTEHAQDDHLAKPNDIDEHVESNPRNPSDETLPGFERSAGSIAIATVASSELATPDSIEPTSINTGETDAQAHVGHEDEEALNAPLKNSEQTRALIRLQNALRDQVTKGFAEKSIDPQTLSDRRHDLNALQHLIEMSMGKTSDFSSWKVNKINDQLPESHRYIAKRLDRLVNALAPSYIRERAKPSDAASLQKGDDTKYTHVMHSNDFYSVCRAQQIWGALLADPKKIRQDVLEPGYDQPLDVSWIADEPVVFKQGDKTILLHTY